MRFAEGQIFVERSGEEFIVSGVVPSLNQILLRASTGYTVPFTITKLRNHIIEGKYRRRPDGHRDDDETPRSPRHLALDATQQEQLKDRQHVLSRVSLLREQHKSWQDIEDAFKKWSGESADADAAQKPPCRRTLQRWRASARKGELAPKKPGWRMGHSRVLTAAHTALDEILKESAQSKTRELLNATTLRRALEERLNRGITDAGQRIRISEKTILGMLRDRAPWRQDLKETLDARTFRAVTRKAEKLVDAERPFELVETDALIPEFHFFDTKGVNLGQPTIYAAIDVATDEIPAIRAYAMAPGVEPLMDFSELLFFPKEPRPDGAEVPWGSPERVVNDLGSEFRSDYWANAAVKVGFEVAFAEGEAGWKKPHIERFWLTLKQHLLRRIPGSTYSTARKTVDPSLPTRWRNR